MRKIGCAAVTRCCCAWKLGQVQLFGNIKKMWDFNAFRPTETHFTVCAKIMKKETPSQSLDFQRRKKLLSVNISKCINERISLVIISSIPISKLREYLKCVDFFFISLFLITGSDLCCKELASSWHLVQVIQLLHMRTGLGDPSP